MSEIRRMVILAEGELGVFTAKTATSLLRYLPHDVVAVLDSEHAGSTTDVVLGVSASVPIIRTIEEATALGAGTLVIGIAPPGGRLPDSWRPILLSAIGHGMDVVSGLHFFLEDDPELSAAARRRGVRLQDLRRPPLDQPIAECRVVGTRAVRILTVGTDCNVGKMAAALEIHRSAERAGLDSRFVATGQTGMMISGSGITLDRIPGDFMSGWMERLVLQQSDADWVVVEGQGGLLHPAYSPVTLGLLHGVLPDAMILVHHAGRTTVRYQSVPIPPLADWVRRYEDAVAPIYRGRVVGIAINPHGLSPDQAEQAIQHAEAETGLPAVDVVRQGAGRLVEAVRRSCPVRSVTSPR